MLKSKLFLTSCFFLGLCSAPLLAQDTTEDEEDFSMYDDLDFADEAAKRYATSKVIGISPQQLIWLGYDLQGPYKVGAAALGNSALGAPLGSQAAEDMKLNFTHGVQLGANIPVYSRNSLIVQLGFNYMESRFESENDPSSYSNDFNRLLSEYTHRTTGLNTTIFKPFNETNFMIVQASADLNGDYELSKFQNLKYTKYSLAAIYGWKKSDRMMWGLGVARTYRVGELNYIPIVLYNWTHPSLKWGAEVLAPARAHLRYNLDPRNLLFFGYELQGQSYRMNNSGTGNVMAANFDNLELRRGEARIRAIYSRQLTGFVWVSAQAGYRVNWSFNADHLPNGEEFFRGTFGDQPYAMENTAGNPWYFNFTISLVSP
jgi:hypothetical protein